MSDVVFGRLTDLPLREAWPHEAHAFTPWLAENIDHLSEVIGVPLELTGTEVAVETFSADILARNPQDDSVVLIENQFDVADHKHLGQILTYLAGLNAQTVIWIAPSFKDAHRSAIEWLNENTADGFSFFAVRLRVVQIGESPFAPIFEIVERPNDWDRQLKKKTESEGAAYYDIKEEFWNFLLDRKPDLDALGMKRWRYTNNYASVISDPEVNVSVWFGKKDSGVFVRSGWGQPTEPVVELLFPHSARLEQELGADLGPSRNGYFLGQNFPIRDQDRERWSELADWMDETVKKYRASLLNVLEGEA